MAVPGELLRSDARPVPKSGSPSWFCRRRYASPHHSTKDRSSSAFQNGGFWKFSLPMNARNSIQGLKRDEFLDWVKRGMWGARFRDFTTHQNWFLGPISCKEMALYHDEWLADQYYQSETKKVRYYYLFKTHAHTKFTILSILYADYIYATRYGDRHNIT